MSHQHNSIDTSQIYELIGIDYGDSRVGVARINTFVKIAEPISTVPNTDKLFTELSILINQYRPNYLVVGLPYNLNHEPTIQTEKVRNFVNELKKYTELEILFEDETLSTVESVASNLSAKHKIDIDQLSAMKILERHVGNSSMNN